MEIGVKYCGGCNSKYDRTEFLEKIKSRCSKDIIFKNVNHNTEVDFIIVLCGCKTACADYLSLKSKHGFILVSNENEIYTVIKKIDELESHVSRKKGEY